MLLAQAAQQVAPDFKLEAEHFSSFNGLEFANPLRNLTQHLDQVYDARDSIIHGDLNLQNILLMRRPALPG